LRVPNLGFRNSVCCTNDVDEPLSGSPFTLPLERQRGRLKCRVDGWFAAFRRALEAISESTAVPETAVPVLPAKSASFLILWSDAGFLLVYIVLCLQHLEVVGGKILLGIGSAGQREFHFPDSVINDLVARNKVEPPPSLPGLYSIIVTDRFRISMWARTRISTAVPIPHGTSRRCGRIQPWTRPA